MPVKIFFCYSHRDEDFLDKLKTHLSPLQWQGLIDQWYDRDISAGTEWEEEIKEYLNTAQIIILLVSPDFMASKYCYSVEMKRAVEGHEHKEARVIPVILRHIYWQAAPFGKLQALPKDAKPVKSWPDQDEAFFNVAEGIRKVVMLLTASAAIPVERQQEVVKPSVLTPAVQQRKRVSPISSLHAVRSWYCFIPSPAIHTVLIAYHSVPMGRPWSVEAMIRRSRCGTSPQARKCAPLKAIIALFCVSRSAPMDRPWSVEVMIRRSRCGERKELAGSLLYVIE